MAVNKKPPNLVENWGEKPIPCNVKNKNNLAIAPRAKTALHSGKMQAIWNFIRKVGEWDRLVNEKSPNPIEDWEGKPTSWKKAKLNESFCSIGLG